MSTFKGPFRLVFEDIRFGFYITGAITLILLTFFFIIGTTVSSIDHLTVTVCGPLLGWLLIIPFVLYNKSYKYVIALGGTRKQYLWSVFINFALFSVVATAITNGLYFLFEYMHKHDIVSITFLTPAQIIPGLHPLLFMWVDILLILFFVGLFLFINSLWFYAGATKLMMIIILPLLGLVSCYIFVDLTGLYRFIVQNTFEFLHILGGIGIVFFVASYSIMANGPLERGGGRIFRKTA